MSGHAQRAAQGSAESTAAPAKESSWLDDLGLGGLGNSGLASLLFGGNQSTPAGEVDDLGIGIGLGGPVGELHPGQWLESDRLLGSRDHDSSFWKASEQNTRDGNAGAYQTIGERHAYYEFADSYLTENRPELNSKWFGAAAEVTGMNALGAADGLNAWFMSDETEDFVRQGNEFLFGHNMKNMAALAENGAIPGLEGLTGKELDYALVDFEQNKLQEFMDAYEKEHGSIDGIAEQLSGNMDSMFAPGAVKESMKQFEEQGIEFDFRNVDHRIMLGKGMVDVAHATPEAPKS